MRKPDCPRKIVIEVRNQTLDDLVWGATAAVLIFFVVGAVLVIITRCALA